LHVEMMGDSPRIDVARLVNSPGFARGAAKPCKAQRFTLFPMKDRRKYLWLFICHDRPSWKLMSESVQIEPQDVE
jgi:hypothetical protein